MTVLVMLWKEIVDNLRDRQTVFYALLFGPVLLPLLIGGSIVASLKQATVSFDQPSSLSVSHADRAPNLMEFLHSLVIYVNDGNKHSAKEARKVGSVLNAYSQTINALRMQHRGIDPSIFNSVDVRLEDVSSDGFRGQILASILPFLLIVAMVMGGFYLAIDTTAGERERESLECCFSLPSPACSQR